MKIYSPFLTKHQTRAPRRIRGFSLIELTMALGIVTFALVGVIGVLPLAATSSRQSFDKNRASAIAETLFTSFRSQPFNTVGYLDSQFDANGNLTPAGNGTAPLDLNAATTTTTAITFYATFLDVGTTVTAASDPFGAPRHLYFGAAKTNGADYLVQMHFNNQPTGTVITPVAGAANAPPSVPAQANQVELIISPVARPQDQYRFMTVVANRTN